MYSCEAQNKTSKYTGVCWKKNGKGWQAQFKRKGKDYYGGLFDNEEQAAMKVNLMCDELEMDRKNPMINIRLNAIQQVMYLIHTIGQNS